MKIFIATDSSKGSLTSSVAGAAVKEAAYCVCPNREAETVLLADGGERNVDAFFAGMSGIACGIYSSGKRPVPGRNFYRKNNRIIRPNVEK